MESIILQTHVGADGILHLDVPLELRDADLEVTLSIKPNPAVQPTKTKKTFSQRWRGQLVIDSKKLLAVENKDARLEYLMQRYDL